MKRYGKEFTLTQELMNIISSYMDNEMRESVHHELAPCEPQEFLKRYLELDPDFNQLLKNEFEIEMSGNLIKYEIKKNEININYKNRATIKAGCTLCQNDQDPEIIEPYENKEEALDALKSYRTSIDEFNSTNGTYYTVTEYYVEENTYDEDGTWINGGNVWAFSEIKIELIEKPSYKTLGIYADMESAENALNDYEGKNEVYLSFNS